VVAQPASARAPSGAARSERKVIRGGIAGPVAGSIGLEPNLFWTRRLWRHYGYASRVPFGTGRSTAASTMPSSVGKPVSRNCERKGPICFSGKLTTPIT